ncbi:hypothetical protein [Pseudomonas agarici]
MATELAGLGRCADVRDIGLAARVFEHLHDPTQGQVLSGLIKLDRARHQRQPAQ